nr:MAG TPA: hypothetical protein [Caudoviricetes sp.]
MLPAPQAYRIACPAWTQYDPAIVLYHPPGT